MLLYDRRLVMRADILIVALGTGVLGCHTSAPPTNLAPSEIALRQQLGIPLDAQRVIVFGQNAHLDIDWQHTFDDYYTMFVDDLFGQAFGILAAQPRAYYSVAEMAYLQQYLANHPDQTEALHAAVARGALRIVGGGMTSPDTLLPETELLARDFLYGIQFAEDVLGAHPHAAWLPDSFGHGAAAPDLLVAAGYTSVAFARIDGAPTLYDEVVHSDELPATGSTYDQLQQLGAADFIWQGSGGASILAHFMAGTGVYCQGDNIDYDEQLEMAGGHLGPYRGDYPAFTDASIDKYIAELTPWTKTPYLFVPVGCDFASPKSELISYLDGYDQRRYDDSHVYAVAASFEDFASLVDFHRNELPTISNELSPYYMGFFATRADVKRQIRDATLPFLVAETFATALGSAGASITQAAAPELALLTRADHHDFVTGTSNDAVVTSEQEPLLAEALAAGTAELTQVADAIADQIPVTTGTQFRVLALNAATAAQTDVVELDIPTTNGATPNVRAVASGDELPIELIETPAPTDTIARFRAAFTALPGFSWQSIDIVPGPAAVPTAAVSLATLDDNGAPATGTSVTRVVLSNSHVRAQWDSAAGEFALTSLMFDGVEAIAQPSMVIDDYADSGGLWRLGNEMLGCSYTPIDPTSDVETVEVLEAGALRVRVAFVSATATREVALAAGSPGLDLAITTSAAESTTRAVAFSLAVDANAQLTTSVPGGAVVRSAPKLFTPTYWAAVSWAQVGNWAVLLRQSTGVRMDTAGALELLAVRDARQEQCEIEGGTGTDTESHRIEWRIEAAATAAAAERAAQAFDRPITMVAVGAQPTGDTLAAAAQLLAVQGDGVVSALKPADRGAGAILRTLLLPGPVTVQLSSPLSAQGVGSVDLIERDLARPVTSDGNAITFDQANGALQSVRLQ